MKIAASISRTRGPALTPMIDVVFLLLIFFILVARFGPDQALDLTLAVGGQSVEGPPRLVDVGAATLRLNGLPVADDDLGDRLRAIGLAGEQVLLVRPDSGADLQRVVEVIEALSDEGFGSVALVGEEP